MAKDSDKPFKPFKSIFRQVPKWQDLWFYQKTQVLYQMTYVFCERFLPKWGDRTVDQMVQAARAGKQNIVEGTEDGKTSTQMELQLLNVARSSIGELRQDYEDFLKSRQLRQWTPDDERFQPMQDFTKSHNVLSDYEPYFEKWSAEEMANIGLTLCFQVDTMTGDIAGEIRLAYLHENGNHIPVSGGSISGNMRDFLGTMRMSRESAQYNSLRIPAVTRLQGVNIAGA